MPDASEHGGVKECRRENEREIGGGEFILAVYL